MHTEPPIPDLASLRSEIDHIDSSVHALLMERGEIIDRLIAVKARQGGGSAFRPDREASMMRNMLARHKGLLPLDTVEGIWRIIISTFTFVQSNFSVHADHADLDFAMRDCARFHFGFTVPLRSHASPKSVIDAVARSDGDLGLIRVQYPEITTAWWSQLTDRNAPKVIARFPMVARSAHPAALPVFVLSRPLAEATSREVVLRALVMDRWMDAVPGVVDSLGGSILGSAAEGVGLSVLVSTPGSVDGVALAEAFQSEGIAEVQQMEIGSHSATFEIGT